MEAAWPDVVSSSPEYGRRFAGPVGEMFLERQARGVLELLSPWPGAAVLEVGGGHGQLAPHLIAAGHAVTVLGSNPLEDTLLHHLMPTGGFQYLQAPLVPLPLADASFDLVVALRLMAHVPDPASFVAELCRVARRAVVVDYADLRSLNFLGQRLLSLKEKAEDHVHTRAYRCFWSWQVQRLFAEHGFGRPRRIPQFFFPMALHRLLGRPGLSRAAEAAAGALGLVRLLGSPVLLRVERLS